MSWVKRGLWLMLAAIVALGGWLWLTMLSPWFYERPEELAPIEQRSHQVFVYGTLRYAPVRWIVMHASGEPEPAVLDGYQRNGLDLVVEPGSRVEGLMLTVSAEALARLDRYERLGERYKRMQIELTDGRKAWVYVRLPEVALRQASPANRVALVLYDVGKSMPLTAPDASYSLHTRISHE